MKDINNKMGVVSLVSGKGNLIKSDCAENLKVGTVIYYGDKLVTDNDISISLFMDKSLSHIDLTCYANEPLTIDDTVIEFFINSKHSSLYKQKKLSKMNDAIKSLLWLEDISISITKT